MMKRLLSLLRKFGRDECGAILAQSSIYLIVTMAMVGLAIDGGRFLQLHNNLQDLADAAALAGAAQLDGAQDAQTRATNAAQAIANRDPPARFSYDSGGSTTITTTFLNALNPDTVANGPKDSYYIKVTTASSTTNAGFLAAVTRINNVTHATAIAQGFGNNVANCAPIQSFMCSPFETTETNPGNANNFSSNLSIGTMVHLVNGANAPGNWGLLQPPPPANNNPHEQVAFWAENTLGQQCITGPTQANTRTGDVAKDAQSGMNVRFDSPVGSGDESVSAPIVIDGTKSAGGSGPNHLNGNNCQHFGKGYPVTCSPPSSCVITGSANAVTPPNFDPTNYSATCNSTTSSAYSCPLPRDRTFTDVSTGNAAWSPLLVGNGANQTDLQAYWQNHHSGSFPTIPTGTAPRYYIYQQEASGAAAFTTASDAVEPHGPQCTNSTRGPASRRVINVAIVDCNYWGITGHSTPIPATTLIAQFFMTEPALDDGSMYVEYLGCYSTSPVNSHGCNGSNTTGIPPGPQTLVQLVR
jgi:Flp pilus assembly protein TadG